MKELKIGTRGSALALKQTELSISAICNRNKDIACQTIEIKNTGDRLQGTAEAGSADKKAWIDGLENAILSGEIDCAIHSGKDLPVDIAEGTTVLSILTREVPFDCFVGRKLDGGQRMKFENLPEECIVGTASLRRGSQVKRKIPTAQVVPHRGNVPTRVDKLDQSQELHGIILAVAGLKRLALDVEWQELPPEVMVPAVHQGTLVAQCRADDTAVIQALNSISDTSTQTCFLAERACVNLLEASCKSALGVYATLDNNSITIVTRVLSPDGQVYIDKTLSGDAEKAQELGVRIAEELIAAGAKELL